MTVFVYVNTSKQVGDAEHIKARQCGRRGEMVRGECPRGVAFEYEVLAQLLSMRRLLAGRYQPLIHASRRIGLARSPFDGIAHWARWKHHGLLA
jgi:hypothetical protein